MKQVVIKMAKSLICENKHALCILLKYFAQMVMYPACRSPTSNNMQIQFQAICIQKGRKYKRWFEY